MILAASSLWVDLDFWSGVVFAILVGLLVRYAVPGLLVSLRTRQQGIVERLQQAEKAIAEVERLRAEQAKQRIVAEEQAKALLEEARRDAERTRSELIQQAHAESVEIRKRAEREITLLRNRARAELFELAADLVVKISAAALRQRLETADHDRLFDETLELVATSPAQGATA